MIGQCAICGKDLGELVGVQDRADSIVLCRDGCWSRIVRLSATLRGQIAQGIAPLVPQADAEWLAHGGKTHKGMT